jgi:hypothetical protein
VVLATKSLWSAQKSDRSTTIWSRFVNSLNRPPRPLAHTSRAMTFALVLPPFLVTMAFAWQGLCYDVSKVKALLFATTEIRKSLPCTSPLFLKWSWTGKREPLSMHVLQTSVVEHRRAHHTQIRTREYNSIHTRHHGSFDVDHTTSRTSSTSDSAYEIWAIRPSQHSVCASQDRFLQRQCVPNLYLSILPGIENNLNLL